MSLDGQFAQNKIWQRVQLEREVLGHPKSVQRTGLWRNKKESDAFKPVCFLKIWAILCDTGPSRKKQE